jgi:hypothetical protein
VSGVDLQQRPSYRTLLQHSRFAGICRGKAFMISIRVHEIFLVDCEHMLS